jgi:ATP-binding cassette subfamily B protein
MEFMAREDRPNGNEIITTLPKIEFRNVSFRYPHAKKWALKDINFVLNPGDSMAIVGENGAGKTTLIKLMIGAYEATEGEVLINDIPIKNIKRESYLDQIGALFQDFSRYEFATLGQNVWFGDITQKYNKKKVLEALSDAGLESLADKLEDGLEQVLSKDLIEGKSADLSGGQWQRIGIARAFYRKPNILILDEPTSAVDAKSEYQIFQNIIKNQVGKTTVIISHRFSTVRKAEQIIVLEEGKITERGTHDELVVKNGTYSEMFKLQAEGYN